MTPKLFLCGLAWFLAHSHPKWHGVATMATKKESSLCRLISFWLFSEWSLQILSNHAVYFINEKCMAMQFPFSCGYRTIICRLQCCSSNDAFPFDVLPSLQRCDLLQRKRLSRIFQCIFFFQIWLARRFQPTTMYGACWAYCVLCLLITLAVSGRRLFGGIECIAVAPFFPVKLHNHTKTSKTLLVQKMPTLIFSKPSWDVIFWNLFCTKPKF